MSTRTVANSFRARKEVLTLGEQVQGETLQLRVQIPEVWDVIRVDTHPDEPVRAVKLNALQAMSPNALFADDYFVKLHGHEIFDESASVRDVGARDGSIFLVTHRRRRPVR